MLRGNANHAIPTSAGRVVLAAPAALHCATGTRWSLEPRAGLRLKRKRRGMAWSIHAHDDNGTLPLPYEDLHSVFPHFVSRAVSPRIRQVRLAKSSDAAESHLGSRPAQIGARSRVSRLMPHCDRMVGYIG